MRSRSSRMLLCVKKPRRRQLRPNRSQELLNRKYSMRPKKKKSNSRKIKRN
jgi:hypothetical protein